MSRGLIKRLAQEHWDEFIKALLGRSYTGLGVYRTTFQNADLCDTKILIAVISSHLAAQPRRILASRTCFSVAASRGTRQERMMWSWVRLMCGKWNMCWDDSVDEERCLYRRWRVTGWTLHSRAGGYSHEYYSQIFREDSTWNPWQRTLAKSVLKSFDAICCSFWNHRRNTANCVIESDEIVH